MKELDYESRHQPKIARASIVWIVFSISGIMAVFSIGRLDDFLQRRAGRMSDGGAICLGIGFLGLAAMACATHRNFALNREKKFGVIQAVFYGISPLIFYFLACLLFGRVL